MTKCVVKAMTWNAVPALVVGVVVQVGGVPVGVVVQVKRAGAGGGGHRHGL